MIGAGLGEANEIGEKEIRRNGDVCPLVHRHRRGDGGGFCWLRRGIAIDLATVLENDQREMREEREGVL
jgi:hypothetical protein